MTCGYNFVKHNDLMITYIGKWFWCTIYLLKIGPFGKRAGIQSTIQRQLRPALNKVGTLSAKYVVFKRKNPSRTSEYLRNPLNELEHFNFLRVWLKEKMTEVGV